MDDKDGNKPRFRPVPEHAREFFPDWQAEQMRKELEAMRRSPEYQAALAKSAERDRLGLW